MFKPYEFMNQRVQTKYEREVVLPKVTGEGALVQATPASRKIALFLPSLGGGGAERVLVDLGRGFLERRYSVDLVVANANGPLIREIPEGVRLFDLGASRVLTAFPGLVRYLRKEQPEALLSTIAHANVVAVLAKYFSGVRTRIVVRESTTPSSFMSHTREKRIALVSLLAKLLYPRAAGIVAVSQGVAEDMAKQSRGTMDNITVIYNPVDLERIDQLANAPLDHPWFGREEPPVVLGVGRLTQQKDFPSLIHAFALVRKKHPVRLLILGEGEERGNLTELVRALGIEEDVEMPGFVSNPFAYMRRARVFVLSSSWEGMPNVLIQAVALGCPVVSTDCKSGPREILTDERIGRLVPVGDAVALGHAIENSLDQANPSDLSRERLKTLETFLAEGVVERYLNLLLGNK